MSIVSFPVRRQFITRHINYYYIIYENLNIMIEERNTHREIRNCYFCQCDYIKTSVSLVCNDVTTRYKKKQNIKKNMPMFIRS